MLNYTNGLVAALVISEGMVENSACYSDNLRTKLKRTWEFNILADVENGKYSAYVCPAINSDQVIRSESVRSRAEWTTDDWHEVKAVACHRLSIVLNWITEPGSVRAWFLTFSVVEDTHASVATISIVEESKTGWAAVIVWWNINKQTPVVTLTR